MCVYIYIYARVCVCMVYIYIHIYVHTHWFLTARHLQVLQETRQLCEKSGGTGAVEAHFSDSKP